jgi:hypothetical protein
MKQYKNVLIGILATAIIIGIADVIMLLKGIPTISATITYYTFDKKIVLAPMFMGILIGHFFWLSNRKLKKWYFIPIILIGSIVVLQAVNLIFFIHPMAHVAIGILLGHFVWPQAKQLLIFALLLFMIYNSTIPPRI